MDPSGRTWSILHVTVVPAGEQNGRRVVFREKTRGKVQGDTYVDFGGPDETAGKGWRMMEVPRDASGWASGPLNSKKELWAPPAERDAKLEVVKSGSCYDIRAYKGERKPSRLYEDDEDEELRYKIPPEDACPGMGKELEEERREIIRSQVVRKSHTIAERWASPEEQLGARPGPSHPTGPAVGFDSLSPSRGSSSPVDPHNVDTEQIDFAAARQQFLALEKSDPTVLLGSKRDVVGPRGRQGDEGQGPITQEKTPPSNTPGRGGLGGSHERTGLLVWPREGPPSGGRDARGPAVAGERLASGLGPLPQKVVLVSRGQSGALLEPDPAGEKETPIEREIRLARQREEDHRRERGIPRAKAHEELVEIQTRSVLLAPVSPSPASSRKGKEKPLTSFCIQREAAQEAEREVALQKEGRLPAAYDKGAPRQQLAERRKVFEREAEAAPPSPGRATRLGDRAEPLNSHGPPASGGWAPRSHGGARTEDQDGTVTSEAFVSSSAPGAGQARLGKGRSLSGWRSAMAHPETDPPGLRPPSPPGAANPAEEPGVLREEHFAIPVGKLRFSFSGDREPPSTRGKARQSVPGGPRESLYTLKTWRSRTSALIDQEIQEALEREMELQEQRRKARLASPVAPDSPLSSQSSGKGRRAARARGPRGSSRRGQKWQLEMY